MTRPPQIPDCGGMNILEQDSLERYPDQALVALERLEFGLKSDPAAKPTEVHQAIRIVPNKRALFLGEFGGVKSVFRIPLSDDARDIAANEWAESTRAHDIMPRGPYNVAKPLYFNENSGISAIKYIAGEPLLTHMWSLPVAARPPLITQSAQWLRTYTETTETYRPINGRPWRNWATKAIARQPHKQLQKIEARIMQKMHKLSRNLVDAEWRVALGHGDFHCNNLIYSDTGLTGIDLGGTNHAPVYKDIARCLTHMARRGMVPSGERHFGVDRAAFAAFADTFNMSGLECNGFMPFMIAYDTLIKVEHPQMPNARIRHAVEMSEALFEDLRNVV